MNIKFSETRLEEGEHHLKLKDRSGRVLLELRNYEIEDAIHTGYIDPESYHYSMFQYFRMLGELQPMASGQVLPFKRPS